MTSGPDGPFLVGLDVGSQSVRALLTARGRCLACAARPTPTRTLGGGRAEYDLAALWQVVRDVLAEMVAQLPPGGQIAGIAAASVGEAVVLLDAGGAPLADPLTWFDRRTEAVARDLADRSGDTLFEVTGQTTDPTYSLCKLLWHRQDDRALFDKTRRVLNIADWIAWQLCGEAATDPSLASRTLCMDIHNGGWATGVVERVGIDPDLLPPIRPAGTAIGRTRPDLGLPGLPVVAVGGHDHIVGGYAAGAASLGCLLDSMGTAEALLATVARPPLTLASRASGFAQGLNGFGRAYVGGGINSSGGAVEWARGLFGPVDPSPAPPGSLGACFVPHLAYASPPHQDFSARGAFIGLRTDTTKAAMLRSVLEGLAFEARQMTDALSALPGVGPARDIRLIGGSTRNDLFMQIKAAVFGCALRVIEVPEATALGAALLAGMGAGLWPDMDAAVAEAAPPGRTIEPDPVWEAVYAAQYDRVWRRIAPALRPIHRGFPAADG